MYSNITIVSLKEQQKAVPFVVLVILGQSLISILPAHPHSHPSMIRLQIATHEWWTWL